GGALKHLDDDGIRVVSVVVPRVNSRVSLNPACLITTVSEQVVDPRRWSVQKYAWQLLDT
ncbi:hypothetical protein, partial [Magnetospirillum sp. UT-4]|uniref:hypothetical protein n=1 Tax=Magnetospirillum sp. UT-4 TaxID=2681467 RepID=UPI001C2DE086